MADRVVVEALKQTRNSFTCEFKLKKYIANNKQILGKV